MLCLLGRMCLSPNGTVPSVKVSFIVEDNNADHHKFYSNMKDFASFTQFEAKQVILRKRCFSLNLAFCCVRLVWKKGGCYEGYESVSTRSLFLSSVCLSRMSQQALKKENKHIFIISKVHRGGSVVCIWHATYYVCYPFVLP